jgi:1,4-dihydroxy-2-naphthoate octaprenyltransferase
LVGAFLLYALGMGVAFFLAEPLDWGTAWLGLGCVWMWLLSSSYLKAFYDAEQQSQQRRMVLLAALLMLAVGAALTGLLFLRGQMKMVPLLFLGLGFFLSFFYGVPPLRLVYSGYGELAETVLLTNITPVLAFVLQAGEVHRLLAMLTFPLTALFLAMRLAGSLESYAADLKAGRRTLMVRMGWARGMILHNILVLSAYVLLGAAAWLGMPRALAWPGFLTLPVGLYQVWQMVQIGQGAPTRWQVLRLTAAATTFVTAYLLAFACWTG